MHVEYAAHGLGPWSYPNERPKTRGECFTFPRPCPFVTCRYHLAVDPHRNTRGNPALRVLHEDPTQMRNTCALDVADGLADIPDNPDEIGMRSYGDEAAQVDLHTIGSMIGTTAERVRQTVSHVQEIMRSNCAQSVEDYEIEVPEDRPERNGLEVAQRVIVRQLASGPKHVSELRSAVTSAGVSQHTVAHALRRLKPRITNALGDSFKRGTWAITSGKTRTIHPRPAAKAGSTK